MNPQGNVMLLHDNTFLFTKMRKANYSINWQKCLNILESEDPMFSSVDRGEELRDVCKRKIEIDVDKYQAKIRECSKLCHAM